jgi:hypothetical protein
MRARSVLQQAFALQGRFPGSRGHVSRRGCLVWSTSLTPTDLSRSYEIEVIYDGRRPPRVRVLDELATREGRPLPHAFASDWLCLYDDEKTRRPRRSRRGTDDVRDRVHGSAGIRPRRNALARDPEAARV